MTDLFAEHQRKAGRAGGRSHSRRKLRAARRNLAKARKLRWAEKYGQTAKEA